MYCYIRSCNRSHFFAQATHSASAAAVLAEMGGLASRICCNDRVAKSKGTKAFQIPDEDEVKPEERMPLSPKTASTTASPMSSPTKANPTAAQMSIAMLILNPI